MIQPSISTGFRLLRYQLIPLIAIICFTAISTSAQSVNKPNVVFIISDDLSAEALASYGNPKCQTPNIDRLASRGILFERAYCQFPVCGAARAALMSGQFAPSINVMGNGGASNFARNLGNHHTWSQHFINNGYYAARVSKIYHMRVPGDITAGVDGPDHAPSWIDKFNCKGPEWMSYGEAYHLTNQKLHFNPTGHYSLGFGGAFYVVRGHTDGHEQPDVIAANKAVEILQSQVNSQSPFFLAVGFVRPHVPLVAPEKFYEPYPPESLEVPNVPADDWDDIPKAGISHNSKSNGLYNKPFKKKQVLEAYYASVSFMDAQVGKILDSLDDLNLANNTIVIFTSDHGYHLGEHDLWQKVSLHEESVRVPLIVAGPSIVKNVRSQSLAQHIDLYPTISRLAGLDVPDACEGRDISLLLTQNQNYKRDFVHSCTGKGHLLRTETRAFMRYNDGTFELYDMISDPGQFTNLAANPSPQITAELKAFNAKLDAFLFDIK